MWFENTSIIILLFVAFAFTEDLDSNGYILYCPCMGRFGNQADHFLGALGFAKGLNRTLALPAWVEYRYGEARSIQVPFNTYFQVESLQKFHHVVTMEEFMKKIAPEIWLSERRIVLAFTGAPASFPIQEENKALQKYLVWSKNIQDQADDFIRKKLPRAFVGIHLRNGVDWVRACEHVHHSPNLFAAPQCLGYRNERGVTTPEMCLPSKDSVIRQLKRTLRYVKDVKSLFVASDGNHMIPDLREALKRMAVEVIKLEPPNPHIELAILGSANHFIGNCISSFSAFVKRARDVRALPTTFWAFPPERNTSSSHDEL